MKALGARFFHGLVALFPMANCAAAAALLLSFFAPTPLWAATVTCMDGETLPPGNGQDDLEVIGECMVGEGETYHYGDVNIFGGGSLIFEDPEPGKEIHFWARSILIETDSSLIAGTPELPIGDRCQAARTGGKTSIAADSSTSISTAGTWGPGASGFHARATQGAVWKRTSGPPTGAGR